MVRPARKGEQPQSELFGYLTQTLDLLRWATIALLLLLTLIEPVPGRLGVATWAIALLFAAYNLASQLIFHYLVGQGRAALATRFIIDLPAAALCYFMSADPGAPLFILIVLAVICAAVSMSLSSSLVYAGGAALLSLGIEPSLPNWIITPHNVRELGTRMCILLLAGIGTSMLARRLALEQQIATTARAQTATLQVREKQREDFVSSVSHSLRTPFTALRAGLGMLEVSLADRMRPNERRLLEEVRYSADQVGIRINDLLALNQIEANALRLDLQRIDLRDVITDAIAVVHPLIIEKGQVLEVDLPDPLPMAGDANRLEQVTVNLLENAHQHTPGGTCIEVSGRATSIVVTIEVSDNGPGVPPGEEEAIFHRFHRADRSEGGLGLGLDIVRAIVQLHGGTIEARQRPGGGALFHVTLPCEPAAAPGTESAQRST